MWPCLSSASSASLHDNEYGPGVLSCLTTTNRYTFLENNLLHDYAWEWRLEQSLKNKCNKAIDSAKNHLEFYLEISSLKDHEVFLYTNHTLQSLCKVEGMIMSIVQYETRPTEDKGNILKSSY